MILVGAAGTATAQPKQEETSGRVSLKEEAADSQAPRAPSEWVELASATPAKHGTEYIGVGKDQGGFGRLRLDAVKGAVPVKQVRVSFSDGKSKTFRVQKRVDARRADQKSIFIDLPTTAEITQIVVSTDARSKGEYALYGSGTGGQVANR